MTTQKVVRKIATRLDGYKFNQLLEWARANAIILQSHDRTELAKQASEILNFPVSDSTFATISKIMGVEIGRRNVLLAKENIKSELIEQDIKVLANVLSGILKTLGGVSKPLDEIIERRGAK